MSDQKKTPGRPQIYQGWQDSPDSRSKRMRNSDVGVVRQSRPDRTAVSGTARSEQQPERVTRQNQPESEISASQNRQVFSPRRIADAGTAERAQKASDTKTVRPEGKRKQSQQKEPTSQRVPHKADSLQETGTERQRIVNNTSSQILGKRHREQENDAKMRSLSIALGVLTGLLIIAIIYEVVLGNGIKETGAERMAAQDQETIVEILSAGQAETASEEETVQSE